MDAYFNIDYTLTSLIILILVHIYVLNFSLCNSAVYIYIYILKIVMHIKSPFLSIRSKAERS